MTTRKRVGLVTPPEVTVEQIIIGGSDVVNFPAPQGAGIAQGNVLTATIGTSSGGFSTVQGPTTATTTQTPGLEVVHTFYDLTAVRHAENMGQIAGGDWTEVDEANGPPSDTGTAKLEEGLVLVQGTLASDITEPFGYGPWTDKDALTITKVEAICYYSFENVLLPGTTLQIDYAGMGPTIAAPTFTRNMRTLAGNGLSLTSENHLSTGEVFDITADGWGLAGDPWTWANFDDFEIRYTGTILVDTGLTTIQVNASAIRVTATLTEAA